MLNVRKSSKAAKPVSNTKETPAMSNVTSITPVSPLAPVYSVAVQKGVPMPASRATGSTYPWATMEPGDSFFAPGGKVETFYTSASAASKKHGCKFVARKWTEEETGATGVRVWRVS